MRSLAGISTILPSWRNLAEFRGKRSAPRGDLENLKRSGLFAYSGAASPPQYEWNSLILPPFTCTSSIFWIAGPLGLALRRNYASVSGWTTVEVIDARVDTNFIHHGYPGLFRRLIEPSHCFRNVACGDDLSFGLDSGFDDICMINRWNEGDHYIMHRDMLF